MKSFSKVRKKTILLIIILTCALSILSWQVVADGFSGEAISSNSSDAQSSVNQESENTEVSVMPFAGSTDQSGKLGECVWTYRASDGDLVISPDPTNPTVLNHLPTSTLASANRTLSNLMVYYVETVTITDDIVAYNMQKFFFGYRLKQINGLSHIDVSEVENMIETFSTGTGNARMTELIGIENWDLSKVKDMTDFFYNQTLLEKVDVSNWNMSNVQNIQNLFGRCLALNPIDVSQWDVSNVTNMSYVFSGCYAVEKLDVKNWVTTKATTMYAIFADCQRIETLDIEDWNISNCKNIGAFFSGCSLLKEAKVSKWDVSNVDTFMSTFSNCPTLTYVDTSQWDTSSGENFRYMFQDSTGFTELDLSNFDTSKSWTFQTMFAGCSNLTKLNLSSFTFVDGNNGVANVVVNNMLLNVPLTELILGDDFIFDNGSGNANSSMGFVSTFNVPSGFSTQWRHVGPETIYPTSNDFIAAYTANPTAGTYVRLGVPYTIRLDGNTGTIPSTTNTTKDISTSYAAKEVSLDNPFLKTGYNFKYWTRVMPDGSTKNYTDGEKVQNLTETRNDTIIFEAQWEPIPYKVEFRVNSGVGVVPDVDPIYYDDFIPLPTATVTKDHFELQGWYTDIGLTSKWDFSINKMPASDLVLYAGWEQVEWEVSYVINDVNLENDPSYQPIYVRYGTPIPNPPVLEQRLFKCVGWYRDPSITTLWDFSTEMMPKADVTLYAGWERSHWEVFFDANGGEVSGLPKDMITPVNQPLDISIYQPGASNTPIYPENGLLGWKDENGAIVGNRNYIPTGDVYLKADWISLADIITRKKENIVVYKNENTPQEVESVINVVAEYTDYLGKGYTYPVLLDWNPVWLTEGGVNEIHFYLLDPANAERVYGKEVSYLYVLNRPYINAVREIWIFVGEWINPDNLFATGYGETPNFDEKRIDRGTLDLVFNDDAVDVNTVGTYWASFSGGFKDYDLKQTDFNFPVIVHVRARQGLTREEQLQVDSSYFWVRVTEIYHTMEKGQIIDINPSNYTDGGSVLTETVADGLGYDRQLNVQVGEYIYMSPDIVNVLQEEKTGQMNVYLNGRSWIFNSNTTDAVGNDYPKGYYDLRMDVTKKEAITNLVGADTPQMQLGFSMNRTWFGTPTFVITPNESIKSAVAGGATPYLFHYNESTNELELVGSMTVQSNGSLSIPMDGVYKDYVILTSLPQNGNYRITEHTNALDSKTYEAVANNVIDSGHALPSGNGLNGISTTKYARITEEAILSEKSETTQNTGLVIGLSALGIALVGGNYVFWKKKKGLDD